MKQAQYECTKCKFQWPGLPGTQSGCPFCKVEVVDLVFKWPYVKWLNYREFVR